MPARAFAYMRICADQEGAPIDLRVPAAGHTRTPHTLAEGGKGGGAQGS